MHLPHIAYMYTVLLQSIVASHVLVQTTRQNANHARATYHCHTGRRCILLLLATTTTTIAADATAVRLGVGLAAELRHGQLAAVVQIVVAAADGLLLGWLIRLLLVVVVRWLVRLLLLG